MLQSGAHVGNRDFEEAKRCAKENPLSGQVLGYHFFWKLLVGIDLPMYKISFKKRMSPCDLCL